jgi:hypothetical protein
MKMLFATKIEIAIPAKYAICTFVEKVSKLRIADTCCTLSPGGSLRSNRMDNEPTAPIIATPSRSTKARRDWRIENIDMR